MARYKVTRTVVREEEEYCYITASSKIEAAEYAEANDEWDEGDADGVDSWVDVELVPDDHAPSPISWGGDRGTRCKACDQPVQWTGTDAKDSPTGKTIPGPWIHTEGGE